MSSQTARRDAAAMFTQYAPGILKTIDLKHFSNIIYCEVILCMNAGPLESPGTSTMGSSDPPPPCGDPRNTTKLREKGNRINV